MVHHGDEQIEQHNDVDNGVRTEHEHSPEPCEYLDSVQFKTIQVHQAEHGPEQRLGGLEQTVSQTDTRIFKCDRYDQRSLYANTNAIYEVNAN